MKQDPCKICGGSDVTLIDGFYYCVECGTQDVNAQETIVEKTFLADGTLAHTTKKKFTLPVKDGIKMSGEWHKWHTYNFVLCGLADELIGLGAKPSFKMKVLWVWTRYIKKYQVKDDLNKSNHLRSFANEKSKTNTPLVSDEELSDDVESKKKKDTPGKDINVVSKGLLLAMLYVALNLDRSDLHMSHLFRFMKNGELSLFNFSKFIPKELDTKSIPQWLSFMKRFTEYNPYAISELAMSVLKTLNLGTPIVPDLRKLIETYVMELCLPNDFKNLVFALMNLVPCDYLDMNYRTAKKMVRFPDFEATVMAYFLIAFKICFGLDCDYEIKLSDAVEKINEKSDHVKSYKIGMYVEETDRLFSFREWLNYLQFRKIILCKYCLVVADKYNLEVDDFIFMEHVGERAKRKIELHDEVTMDILKKIPLDNYQGVIPKSEFAPSLTPMTSYTKIVMDYIQDPELKLLLSEDFTQYSLKYACESLSLPTSDENILKGVTDDNKIINPTIIGTLGNKTVNKEMVYVRNCENENWLKTKPPSIEHVTKISDNSNCSEKDSDHGYDSNIDCTPNDNNSEKNKTDSNCKIETEIEKSLELIEEESENINIFDDPFDDLYVKQELLQETYEHDEYINDNVLEFSNTNAFDSKLEVPDEEIETDSFALPVFNPNTFDRTLTVRELVLAACKEYKIPVPHEYTNRKRKPPLLHITAGATEVKKRKVDNRRQPGELQSEIENLMSTYQTSVHQDIFTEIMTTVNNLTANVEITNMNESIDKNEDNIDTVDEPADLTSDIKSDITTNDVVDNQSENGELSVIENTEKDDWDINDLKRKGDPKFDEKSHDINQLYIKFSSEGNFDNLLQIDDPELNEILDKKVNEAEYNTLKRVREKNNKNDVVYDSEDDVPLSVIFEEGIRLKKKASQRKEKLDPLMSIDNITEFKYWFRHYSKTMSKNLDMQQKFDLELRENCPSSFNFVIKECAAIVECSAYSLYKNMQNLEQMFIAKIKQFNAKENKVPKPRKQSKDKRHDLRKQQTNNN